jgi:hypothetical protein
MTVLLAMNFSQGKEVERTKAGKNGQLKKRFFPGSPISATVVAVREESDYSSIAPLIFRRCSRKV